MWKQIGRYPLLWISAAVLVVGMFADILTPDRESSEMENRELAQRPTITWRSLTSTDTERKYSTLYETYLNDQFVGRDAWITLKSLCETVLGKLENNGIVYGKEGFQFAKEQSYDWWRADVNTEAVAAFGQSAAVQVDFGLIPSSYCVYGDYLPKGLGNIDQREIITKVYESLSSHVNTVDFEGALTKAREAGSSYRSQTTPLYYRNDHHWTTYGAYVAYNAYVESLGMEAVPMADLEPYAHIVDGFYGTYYNKSKLAAAQADDILYYDLPLAQVNIDGEDKPTLHDNALWSARNKYAAFLWDNNGLTILRSDRPQHEKETSRILVLKDSFGNCFAPFLTLHYDEVYVVDLRYLPKTVSELMEEVDFDRVLVLYNVSTFGQDTYLMRISQ